MSQQQQKPQATKRAERRHLQERRILLASIAALFLIGGAVLWILSSQGILRGTPSGLLPIIFTVMGVFIGLFQWLFPVSAGPPQQLPGAPAPPPQIIVHVPPTLASREPISSTPTVVKTTYRGIVGVPPPTDSRTIQQRQRMVQAIYTRLIQPEISALALTGIGGVGKSTLAALVYRYAEEQRSRGNGPFGAEALWLHVDSSVTMVDLAGNLFEALGEPLPDFTSLSLHNQAQALLHALDTTENARLIIFDQFEDLLDWQTGHALVDRPGVGEWIDALNSQPCTCRMLLTTRLLPKGTREYPPTYLQEYPVKGLETREGVELLQKLGVEASEQELQTVVERCSGHAFALTLLASLLRHHHVSLATFFRDPMYTQLWSGNIARNLLDYIYQQQLDTVQRTLLTAFSIYRESVPLEAAQSVIDSQAEFSRGQVHSALDALLTQHLLQTSGEGFYQLHAIVASYAQSYAPEGNEAAQQHTIQTAHARAAEYYLRQLAKQSPPRGKRQHISDVEPLIEAIWHYCQAEQWQTAYTLMEQESLFKDLREWGGNAILLELYKLLLPPEKWQAERLQAAHIYNNLGVIYRSLGRGERAQNYLEDALQIYEEEGDRTDEGWSLNHLGRVYSERGDKEQARRYYEQALKICEEEGDRMGEAAALNNLGRVYGALGLKKEEQQYYEQALLTNREVGDRQGEGSTLNNLGRVFDDLGEHAKAKAVFEQALHIFRELGRLRGEGWTLNNLGKTCDALGEKEQARQYLEQALTIRREVDHRGEGRTLNNLGAVYAHLEQQDRAMACYQEALNVAREVGDREGEGKTLRNAGMLFFEQQRYNVALAALLLAKQILDELQSPYRYSAQEWMDAIRKEIGEERFVAEVAQVEPRATQVVAQALA